MTSVNDLRLYHGNDLDVLAELLARELAMPHPQGALAPEWVLIPQPSMRRWLQRALAEKYGVAANIRFLAPGEYVQSLMQAGLQRQPSSSLQRERLPWRVFKQLHSKVFAAHAASAPLRALLGDATARLKSFELAQTLAQSFEHYQAWRRDWLQAWESGADVNDWQAELWRGVSAGNISRAQLITDLLNAQTFNVPAARVFVFACLNISPDVLRVICRSAEQVPVHLFVPSPSSAYWGDVQSVRERLRTEGENAFEPEEHPLLASCGRAGREFMRCLFGDNALPTRIDIEAYVQPANKASMLGRLRLDLLERRAPRMELDAELTIDDTLRIHACTSRLREVEVLHETLRGVLEQRPDLQARDIAVLAPNIAEYTHLIDAVFGAARGTTAYIPYQFADQSQQDSPLLRAFLWLLQLPECRFSVADLETLLQWPWLRSHYPLLKDSADALLNALAESGMRWGLHVAQKQSVDSNADESFSLQFALRRLLLGHAIGTAQLMEDVCAQPLLEAQQLDALNQLLQLCEELDSLRLQMQQSHTAQQWHAVLIDALNQFLPDQFDQGRDDFARERVLHALRELLEHAAPELQQQTISSEVVRHVLHEALSAEDARAPWLSGGVSVSQMVPMRLIPYKVICLLGLNVGEFPRTDAHSSINRLSNEARAAHRRVGDRNLHDDDKFLFLQLLSTTEQMLHLSYVESTEKTGMSASPLLHELENCCLAYFAEQQRQSLQQRLHISHPAQVYESDVALLRTANQWQSDSSAAVNRDFSVALTVPIAKPISVKRLLEFIREPAAVFLAERFAAQSKSRDERWLEFEAFEQDSLQRWELKQKSLQWFIDASARSPQALHRALQAQALVPAGPSGFAQAERLFASLRIANHQVAIENYRMQSHAIDLLIDDQPIQGEILMAGEHAWLHIQLSKFELRHQQKLALQHCLLSAQGWQKPLRVIAVHDGGARAYAYSAPSVQQAEQHLRKLVQLYEQNLQQCLPLTDACADEFVSALNKTASAEQAWHKAGKQWPSEDSPNKSYSHDYAATKQVFAQNNPFTDFASPMAQRFCNSAQTLINALTPRLSAAENSNDD